MSFPDPKTFINPGAFVSEDLQCSFSSISITVLPELTGKPWDEVSLAYVLALRPSKIRVCTTGCHCDSMRWRVTVWMKDDKINRVEQEVRVWLPDGIAHGSALKHALRYGKDSPQATWHNDAEGYTMIDSSLGGGYFKHVGGKSIPFPT